MVTVESWSNFKMKRQFICYFYFVSWFDISLGCSLNLFLPNLELHIPFGFIRIGFVKVFPGIPLNYFDTDWRIFGYGERNNL
jgi:hypothetical protein